MPVFTVIMATWGRGRHILPSIASVLQQDYRDFELIVVGDACSDETESVVTAIADPRVRWLNLTERCGSQAAPNNAGIAAARGDIIAYLGHDDIWEPDHLQRLAGLYQTGDAPDFGVSGAIGHLPNGVPGSQVFGLFTADDARQDFFFPPSCLSHRKDVTDRIGVWRMPMAVRAPVDEEFQMRAAAVGLHFRSTGVVTVHKFASTMRYLSYVQPQSDEQDAMLKDLGAPDHAARIAGIVAESRRLGRYMVSYCQSRDHLDPGQMARENASRRGLMRPALRPLDRGASIRQRPGLCVLDWRDKPVFGIRFHGKNPKPRLLLPFSATGPVSMSIRVVHSDRAAFAALTLRCNQDSVTAHPRNLRQSLWGWTALFDTGISLLADSPSLLEFHLTLAQQQRGRGGLGFGIGKIRLQPL